MDDDLAFMAAMAMDGEDNDVYAALSPRSRRKRKNRDQMRAARQREKETMGRLHGMVERLEAQFRKLQEEKHVHSTGSVTPPISKTNPAASNGAPTANRNMTPAAYAEALSLKARFQEENFHLKQTLYEKNKLKETLERHVGDFVEPTPEETQIIRQEFPGPGHEATPELTAPVDTSQSAGSRTEDQNAYSPLSESAVWAIIGDVHRRMSVFQQSLATPSTPDVSTPQSRTTITILASSPTPSATPATGTHEPTAMSEDEFPGNRSPESVASSSPQSPPSMATSASSSAHSLPPFCGWDVRHEHVHNNLRFYFEKVFPHATAFDAMVRMWDNEISMISYRDVPHAGRQTMGVVQQLNDDTYIFQRRLVDASTNHRELVSTYLRYRLRTPREGFLIGSVSIDDAMREIKAEGQKNVRERVWAAKLYLWTEFVPILNNTGCTVRMTGSINLNDPSSAQSNIASLVIGLLRWENLHIGPVFALTNS